MDAAQAAAMSDPELNRWFRRRWNESLETSPRVQASEGHLVAELNEVSRQNCSLPSTRNRLPPR
jgi:hypothetical protein